MEEKVASGLREQQARSKRVNRLKMIMVVGVVIWIVEFFFTTPFSGKRCFLTPFWERSRFRESLKPSFYHEKRI